MASVRASDPVAPACLAAYGSLSVNFTRLFQCQLKTHNRKQAVRAPPRVQDFHQHNRPICNHGHLHEPTSNIRKREEVGLEKQADAQEHRAVCHGFDMRYEGKAWKRCFGNNDAPCQAEELEKDGLLD